MCVCTYTLTDIAYRLSFSLIPINGVRAQFDRHIAQSRSIACLRARVCVSVYGVLYTHVCVRVSRVCMCATHNSDYLSQFHPRFYLPFIAPRYVFSFAAYERDQYLAPHVVELLERTSVDQNIRPRALLVTRTYRYSIFGHA